MSEGSHTAVDKLSRFKPGKFRLAHFHERAGSWQPYTHLTQGEHACYASRDNLRRLHSLPDQCTEVGLAQQKLQDGHRAALNSCQWTI